MVSDKSDKTIVVKVVRNKKHKLYQKTIAFSRKFMAHDESNEAKEGDVVMIEESKPISKNKTWVLKEILEKAV